jgi:dihydroxyacetone kinase-like predicted kinase
VAGGAGNRRLFESLGARVVEGGRTMNPSTAELLAAVEADPAPEAIILPNDRNVHLAAEHAAEHATKPVRVVPTVSLQAGLAAMVAFDAAAGVEENADAMQAAADEVVTGAVTIASRDVTTNGLAVSKGAWLGLADDAPVAGGASFDEVARAVLARLLAEPRSVLTLLTGEEPPPLDSLLEELERGHPELELEVHEGGQPHYALLISAE